MPTGPVEGTVSAEMTGRRGVLAAYVALTKPRIIELLLITTVPSMALAAGGWPGTWLVAATLIGGTLSAAGANALNNYIDRDIDALMRRTRSRPMPARDVEPRHALVLGVALGAAGFGWLALTSNLLAALLATAALLFYVLVYSARLKRSTSQNIVIGGAAGAAPVLVGWAAVTGSLHPAAWALFLVVFYWTPPHFWALALRYREDYARAGVPMLPVVAGASDTTRRMLLYSGLTASTSLLVIPFAPVSWVYLMSAVVLGGWFVYEAWRVHLDPARAMRLFGVSTVYLAALFASLLVDTLLA